MPAGHAVSAVHAGFPHLFGTPPPPQVVPAGQVGHVMMLPQPSPVWPHSMPWFAHVSDVHVA